MATFTYTPDFTANLTKRPRVRQVSFGDGYEQRTADGINTIRALWSLSFNTRTDAERDAILGFFEARAGIEAFDWTPPTGSAGKFVCREWTTSLERFGINNITVTFEQVFE
jgi:phage-related protein